MGFLELIGLREAAPGAGVVATLEHKLERLSESYAQLELSREDVGWQKISAQYAQEFSREGLRTSCEHGRVFAVANPIIKRGLGIRSAYVFGQGVGTTARGDGTDGSQDVNALVQQWLDDPDVREVFAGAQAQERNETALGTDGNVFFALFTAPLTGRVTPRLIDFDEITDKISNPEDKARTWYYLREWVQVDTAGKATQHKAYYPDVTYRPLTRERTLNGIEVMWDAPIYHVKVNALNGWKFGIGDVYAALPWARGYKEFLEDWALLMKSLSRIAWRTSSSSAKGAQQKRAGLAGLPEIPAGSTANMTGDQKIEAVPKSGATLDSESAKPLAAMVAAALGVPVTMLLSDPGQTGARAVAETLNKPTKLEMNGRQEVWREARRQLLGYVIEQAVIAPRGPLKGTIVRDGDRLRVTLPSPEDMTLDIVFPELDEIPLDLIVKAIVDADATGKLPPLLIAEQLLRALRIRDIDEWLDQMKDDNGNFVDPSVTAGDVAANAFRNGQDPAGALK